jgi:thiol-disulfide isomerase/thioredoxin
MMVLYFLLPFLNFQNPADSILERTSAKLTQLKAISYTLDRELNYASENYRVESQWAIYLDFNSPDTVLHFRFQIEDESSKFFYNGTEKFDLRKPTKTIDVKFAPGQNDFEANSFFYNSLTTLRNILPRVIADGSITKELKDTVINHAPCHMVTLYAGKKRIQNLGKGFDLLTISSNVIYRIITNQNDLPVAIIQTNDGNRDFILTKFSNLHVAPEAPSEPSWYYSTYTNEYKIVTPKNKIPLIASGDLAPDWVLPLYNRNENISLTRFRGKVVLLDFWIRNCGPCIASIPKLNALRQKFGELEIIGINVYDPKEVIEGFCKKYKPTYAVAMNGKQVAEIYGVSGFPTFVLIDKAGRVLFSGTGLEESKLDEMIRRSL